MSEEEKEEFEEVPIKVEDAPSEMKAKIPTTSGHCRNCGRYTDVPVIDGIVQCKCRTS